MMDGGDRKSAGLSLRGLVVGDEVVAEIANHHLFEVESGVPFFGACTDGPDNPVESGRSELQQVSVIIFSRVAQALWPLRRQRWKLTASAGTKGGRGFFGFASENLEEALAVGFRDVVGDLEAQAVIP